MRSMQRAGSLHSQFRHDSSASRRWLQTGHAAWATASMLLAAQVTQIRAGPVNR
jgi:hypothetical protein